MQDPPTNEWPVFPAKHAASKYVAVEAATGERPELGSEIVADVKNVFSRWPWYDEQETEYQVRYEFSNTIDGDTPFPVNCDNEDMQCYCIGQDQCTYSSLPFPDEMYEQLEEKSAS